MSFARPYAPPDPSHSLSSPRRRKPSGKHHQLFRHLSDAPSVIPTTPVLARKRVMIGDQSATARPASAGMTVGASTPEHTHPTPIRPTSAINYVPGMFTPSTPTHPTPAQAQLQFESPMPRPPPSGSQSARSFTSASAGSPHPASLLSSPQLIRPSTASSSLAHATAATMNLRGSNEEYQHAFLAAVDARHKTEADRLTLFNRLAHLRQAEEKAMRARALTEQQIRRVALARQRHELESQQRLAVSTAYEDAKREAAQQKRMEHQRRRAAFQQYKTQLLNQRREQASALRAEGDELLSHRHAMTCEDLVKFRLIRHDIRERHQLVAEYHQQQKQEELLKIRQQKQWKIVLEDERRQQAEADLREMQIAEVELLERAEQTRREHEAALQQLATLVLSERTLPTARARYASIAALQGRVSPRKVAQSRLATASTTTSGTATPATNGRSITASQPSPMQSHSQLDPSNTPPLSQGLHLPQPTLGQVSRAAGIASTNGGITVAYDLTHRPHRPHHTDHEQNYHHRSTQLLEEESKEEETHHANKQLSNGSVHAIQDSSQPSNDTNGVDCEDIIDGNSST